MSVTTTPTPSSSNQPPSEYLPNRLAPSEAIHNVYELKTQPELIRYLHAAAGFPTKPTWYKAVKNGQFVSWPGLTAAAVAKHFPESEETIKGHARKTRSGLRSTKRKQSCEVNTDNKDNDIETTISVTIFLENITPLSINIIKDRMWTLVAINDNKTQHTPKPAA